MTKLPLLKLSIVYITHNSESKTQPHRKAHSLFETHIQCYLEAEFIFKRFGESIKDK